MYNILLVDDEPLILEGLEHIVKWEEYGIVIAGTALNGEEAIGLLERMHVDIVMTDIRMPNLTGLDVIGFLKEKKRNTRCIVLSGYDEFEYVKKAAMLGIDNYLLKPVNKEELSATLLDAVDKLDKQVHTMEKQKHVREALTILRNNVLIRLISGTIGLQEFDDKCQFLNMDFDYELFTAVVIGRTKNRLMHPWGSNEEQLIHYAMCNIGEETFVRDGVACMAFPDPDGGIVLLLMSRAGSADPGLIDSIVAQTIHNISTFLQQDVFVTIGPTVDEQADIHASYFQAKQLQHYSVVSPANRVLRYADIDRLRDRRESALPINFEQLETAIRKGDKDAAADFVLHIYTELERMELLTPSLVQNVTIEILYHLIRNAKGAASSSLCGRETFNDILNNQTISGIAEDLIQLMNRMIEDKNRHENPLIQKVLQTIDERYHTEINLQSMADTLFVNVAYLGQLFKKETGQLFTSYLNQYRVEKAKELLLHTSHPAKQIAQEVGYANPDYFYIIFKKITGVSPSEYKML